MQIHLNGAPRETASQTVAELLQELQIAPVGVAVAINESVVRRARHAEFRLSEGDKIEVIRAVQGG